MNISVFPETPKPPPNPWQNHKFFGSRTRALLALFGGTVSVGVAVIMGHTAALPVVRYLLEDTRDGEAIVLSRKLRRLKDIAMLDLKIPETSKIKMFSSSSELSEVFGTIKSSYGAYIGLPSFLNYENESDVPYVEGMQSSFSEDEADQIVDEYRKQHLFSENAKLYVIAEGLTIAREPDHFLISSVCSSLCFFASFVQSHLIVKYAGLEHHPPIMKASPYVMSALMWMFLLILIFNEADKYVFENALKSLSDKYIDSGIEFYEKALTLIETRITMLSMDFIEAHEVKHVMSVFSDRLKMLEKRRDGT